MGRLLWLAAAAAAAGLRVVRGIALTPEGLDLVAQTAADSRPLLMRIHVSSVGDQGSSMVLDLFGRAGGGLSSLIEPLGGTSEHPYAVIHQPDAELKHQQVRCLFSEDPSVCEGAGIVSSEVLNQLKDFLATPIHAPLLVHTTRIVNFKLIADDLSAEQIQAARFVVLARDPRAVWASMRPYKGWSDYNMYNPLVCRLLAESLFTVPALASAASGNVEVAVYEEWTKDMAGWAEQMGVFFGLTSRAMVRRGGELQDEPKDTTKWASDLTDEEVERLEEDKFCRGYMARVGYKFGKVNGTDYSGVNSSAALQTPLNQSEQELLDELMELRLQGSAGKPGPAAPEMVFEWAKKARSGASLPTSRRDML